MNWNFYNVSMNPNISLDIILDNKDYHWNFNALSSNMMTKSCNKYVNKKINELTIMILNRYVYYDISMIIIGKLNY